jgi:hypothetical protein
MSFLPKGYWIPSLNMFHIPHNLGKTFTNGGFGIALPSELHSKIHRITTTTITTTMTTTRIKEEEEKDSNHNSILGNNNENNNNDNNHNVKNTPYNLYLYLEEALYLHDSGFILLFGDSNHEQQSQSQQSKPLSTQQLYQLLFIHSNNDTTTQQQQQQLSSSSSYHVYNNKISFSMYRTYAHLRQQTYRVLRSPSLSMTNLFIQQQQQEGSVSSSTTFSFQSIPSSFTNIAWYVYEPNAKFAKTNPGPPDFVVVVTNYSSPVTSTTQGSIHSQLRQLMTQTNHHPIKIAVVADSGTVLLLGITNQGVPRLMDKEKKKR